MRESSSGGKQEVNMLIDIINNKKILFILFQIYKHSIAILLCYVCVSD